MGPQAVGGPPDGELKGQEPGPRDEAQGGGDGQPVRVVSNWGALRGGRYITEIDIDILKPQKV